MTPSERFHAALNGRLPDRVPVLPKIGLDLACTITGTELREALADPALAFRVMADAALHIGADAMRVFPLPPRRLEERHGELVEIGPRGRRLGVIDLAGGLQTRLTSPGVYRIDDPVTMAYCFAKSPPKAVIRNRADVQRIAIPDARLLDELGWGTQVEQLRQRVGARLALVGSCGAVLMTFYGHLRGMHRALLDIVEEPRLVHAAMEKSVALAVALGRYWLDHGVQVLRLYDVVGNARLLSPAHWRQFVFPHLKVACAALHRHNAAAKIYYYVSDNVLPIAEAIVATKVDGIAPLDPLGGYSCARFRERAGDSVALLGGVNVVSFVSATPEDLMHEARRCIVEAGLLGAYVLGSGGALRHDARIENLHALSEAARQYGRYENGRLV